MTETVVSSRNLSSSASVSVPTVSVRAIGTGSLIPEASMTRWSNDRSSASLVTSVTRSSWSRQQIQPFERSITPSSDSERSSDLAHVVDDHRDTPVSRVLQKPVDQRRLTGAQRPTDECHRDLADL